MLAEMENAQINMVITEEKHRINLHDKKLLVMKDLKSFEKDGYNGGQHFHFVSESQVSLEFNELFVRHGISFSAEITDIVSVNQFQSKNGGTLFLTTIKMLITLSDGEADEKRVMHSSGVDSSDKGINKAFTSGVKYFLLRNFLSSASDGDSDADQDPAISIEKTKIKSKSIEKEKPKNPIEDPFKKLKSMIESLDKSDLTNEKKLLELNKIQTKWDESLTATRIDGYLHIDGIDYISTFREKYK